MILLFETQTAFGGLSLADLAATAFLAVLLAWVTVSDLRHFRIPDAASLSLILAGLGCSVGLAHTQMVDAVLGAVAGYAVFAGVGAAYYRLTGTDGLGLGDAKLLAAAGAWLGWRDLPHLVAMAAIAALIFALMTSRRKIAFGPWLAGALWVLWIVRLARPL